MCSVEKLKQPQKWAKVQEVPPPGNLVLQGESSYKSLTLPVTAPTAPLLHPHFPHSRRLGLEVPELLGELLSPGL